mmetsp:Transcript_5509/g.20695  ORF Transcript_5509/g.20695 Transcript_5509/m.20695 type:complete len:275 (-) Transcript_5509:60-884(-)
MSSFQHNPHPHPNAPIRASLPKTVLLLSVFFASSWTFYTYSKVAYRTTKIHYYNFRISRLYEQLGIKKEDQEEHDERWSERYQIYREKAMKGMHSKEEFERDIMQDDEQLREFAFPPPGAASELIQKRIAEMKRLEMDSPLWHSLRYYLMSKMKALQLQGNRFDVKALRWKYPYENLRSLLSHCTERKKLFDSQTPGTVSWLMAYYLERATFGLFSLALLRVMEMLQRRMISLYNQSEEHRKEALKCAAMYHNCTATKLRDERFVYDGLRSEDV